MLKKIDEYPHYLQPVWSLSLISSARVANFGWLVNVSTTQVFLLFIFWEIHMKLPLCWIVSWSDLLVSSEVTDSQLAAKLFQSCQSQVRYTSCVCLLHIYSAAKIPVLKQNWKRVAANTHLLYSLIGLILNYNIGAESKVMGLKIKSLLKSNKLLHRSYTYSCYKEGKSTPVSSKVLHIRF